MRQVAHHGRSACKMFLPVLPPCETREESRPSFVGPVELLRTMYYWFASVPSLALWLRSTSLSLLRQHHHMSAVLPKAKCRPLSGSDDVSQKIDVYALTLHDFLSMTTTSQDIGDRNFDGRR